MKANTFSQTPAVWSAMRSAVLFSSTLVMSKAPWTTKNIGEWWVNSPRVGLPSRRRVRRRKEWSGPVDTLDHRGDERGSACCQRCPCPLGRTLCVHLAHCGISHSLWGECGLLCVPWNSKSHHSPKRNPLTRCVCLKVYVCACELVTTVRSCKLEVLLLFFFIFYSVIVQGLFYVYSFS